MVKVERTLQIDRPVAEVFAYLRDVELPRLGASFEVIDYELERRLAYRTLSGAPTTTAWAFQPSGNNTRITFTRVIEASHRLLRLPESLVQELANERANRELAALSRLLAVAKLTAL